MNLKAMTSFAVFLAMIVGFVGYVGSLGIRIKPPDRRIQLSMDVADINNLAVGSNVLLRGIAVGKVSGIDVNVSSATVHFYIDSKYRVPDTSTVRLENLSALGESYVELEPHDSSGPMFKDGQHIPVQAVRQPASISELGASVVRVMNQLPPGQLERIVGEADAALPDPYEVLPNLERASLLLHNTTADLNGRGYQLLENSQSLLANAGFVGPALADATPGLRDAAQPIMDLFNTGSRGVARLPSPGNVYVFGKFLQRIQKLLDDRGPDIRVLTEPLTANMTAIAASLTTVNSSQILANLLASVPEDGAINLHVAVPQGVGGR